MFFLLDRLGSALGRGGAAGRGVESELFVVVRAARRLAVGAALGEGRANGLDIIPLLFEPHGIEAFGKQWAAYKAKQEAKEAAAMGGGAEGADDE